MGRVDRLFNACSQKLKVTALSVSLHPSSTPQLSYLCRALTQGNHYYFVTLFFPLCFPEFNLSPASVSYEFVFVESPKSLDAVGEAVCLCLPHGDAVRSQCLRSWARPRGDCEGKMDEKIEM